MYGAARFVGIGPPVVLGGRTLWPRARTIADYAGLEAVMLGLRGDPFDPLRRILLCHPGNEAGCAEVVQRLRDGWWNPTFREVLDWLRTWEGRLNALALAVRQDVGDVGRWLDQSFGSGDPEECWYPFQQSLDIANGEGELGALQWLDSEAGDQKPIQWDCIFRDLGERPFSFPPSQVAQMTLMQVRAFQGDRRAMGGRPSFGSQKALMAFEERREQQASKIIEDLKRQMGVT